jgi:hypothetical protein
MWGWPKPKCPLGTWEKTWIETRMRWLADRFGIDRLIDATVLVPTADHFPEPYEGTETDARRLMSRICDVMGIAPGSIDLEIRDDELMDGNAGHYDIGETGRPVIRIASTVLKDMQRLIATLAHELAHELLLGRALISREAHDMEWVTDLTPVFFGLGVFAANVTITEAREDWLNYRRWTVRRHGYLPSRMFGYAFALFAFMRGDSDPPWARFLRLDASSPLASGLRFLRRGGATLFHPDTVHIPVQPLSPSEAARRLSSRSASIRVATLWEISERGPKDPALVPHIERCLSDRDRYVPAEAAQTLSWFGSDAASSVPELIRVLGSAAENVRVSSALALGAIALRPDIVVPALAELLVGQPDDVARAAATALRAFGRDAEVAVVPLLSSLRVALITCRDDMADELALALNAAVPDAIARARQFMADDREIRSRATALLKTALLPVENEEIPLKAR